MIKEVKRNINDKLIKVYLPTGFAEFFVLMETIDYYDKPDYDKLIKILEKAKETIPFLPKSKQNTLVDQELFDMDPVFLKFDELLLKHKQSKYKHTVHEKPETLE